MAKRKKAVKKRKKRASTRKRHAQGTRLSQQRAGMKKSPSASPLSVSPRTPAAPVSDDPISQLDSDFAQLMEEIEEIKSMPHGWGQEQLAPLLEVKEAWLEHLEKEPDQAAWRRNLLTRLAESYEQIVRGGHRVDIDGKMSLEPDSELLTREMTPIIEEVLEQGKIWLEDKIKNLKPLSITTQDNTGQSTEQPLLHIKQKRKPPSTTGKQLNDEEVSGEKKPTKPPGEASPEIEFNIDLSSLLGNLFKPPEK